MVASSDFLGPSGTKWYAVAATVAGALLLINKLKKMATRFFMTYLSRHENKDAMQRIINEAIADASNVIQPSMRPLVYELTKAHESGVLSRLDDRAKEKLVGDMVGRKLEELVPSIDRELQKVVPKIRNNVLSELRNEVVIFLFSRGVYK